MNRIIMATIRQLRQPEGQSCCFVLTLYHFFLRAFIILAQKNHGHVEFSRKIPRNNLAIT